MKNFNKTIFAITAMSLVISVADLVAMSTRSKTKRTAQEQQSDNPEDGRSNKKAETQAQEVFECPVCNESFTQSAAIRTMVGCDKPHSFCQDCVSRIIVSAYQDGKNSYECPLCRREQSITNDDDLCNRAIVKVENTKELCHCVLDGKVLSILPLIQAGADPLYTVSNGITLLHCAIFYNRLTILDILLSFDSCKDARFINTQITQPVSFGNSGRIFSPGYSALHMACSLGYLECVKKLVDNGADINLIKDIYTTPLVTALVYDEIAVADYLKSRGAVLPNADEDGFTLLMNCGEPNSAHRKAIKNFLNFGASVHDRLKKDRNLKDICFYAGATPLHFMATEGSIEKVQLLLNAGADVNALDSHGCSPLMYALCYKKFDVAKELINAGASVRNELTEETPFTTDNETVFYSQTTALHIAALTGADTSLLQDLLDKGADLNAVDSQGFSVLYQAFFSGNLDGANYLIQCGAKVGCADNQNQPLIITALFKSRVDGKMVRLLHHLGANIHAESGDCTPLICAIILKNESAAIQLIRLGVNIKKRINQVICRDEDAFFTDNGEILFAAGSTALHMAAGNGLLDVVKKLIKQDASIFGITDSNGKTALDIAKEKNATEVVDYLNQIQQQTKN
jgi:ankyrin repeat protein